MGATDEERLVVALEARINEFEKRFKQAEKTGTGVFQNLRRGSKSAAQGMEADIIRSTSRINQALAATSTKIGAFSKAAIGGLVGGIAGGVVGGGIAGIVSNFQDLAKSVAEVGDQARIAGVSAKSFQELKFAADQVRIPVDALQDGLKELSLRTDEFIASSGKSGSAAESFKRLGYTVGELKQKIKAPSDLLVELVGRVQQLDKAAQTRIFDELFGGQGGEEFVKFLTDGEKGLRANIKAANDLGVVIDDQMIKKAAEVDRQFSVIATRVGVDLKKAIISAAEAMDGFMTQYAQWKAGVDAGNAGATMGGLIGTKTPIGPNQPPTNTTTPTMGRLPSGKDILRGKLLQQRIDQAFEEQSSTYKPAAAAKAAATRSDDLQRDIERLREHTEALKAETAAQAGLNPLIDDYGFAVAKAAAQQDLMNAAKSAGKTVTPELAAEIDKLSEAYANATVASAQLAESQDKIRQRAEDLANLQKDIAFDLIDGFTSGADAADLFANSLKKISTYLLNDVLDSIFTVKNAASGGGGFLSGLFGMFSGGKSGGFNLGSGSTAFTGSLPGYAKGGVANSPSIFAEAGPEAAVPLPDGRRIPVDLGTSAPSQATQDVNFNMTLVVQGTGTAEILEQARQGAAEQMSQALRAYDKAMPDRVSQIRREPRRR
ncbi:MULTISPECIES: phage tail tape measure protein [unclassified Rhizobium]|uniref:phage tail tape measure protein n=1 Tax=unclassified Rhizobium TaxID=2613769 RepID=UPI0025F003AE|nr:phage tail tape measure protein [Rhizobium sp. UBA1881]